MASGLRLSQIGAFIFPVPHLLAIGTVILFERPVRLRRIPRLPHSLSLVGVLLECRCQESYFLSHPLISFSVGYVVAVAEHFVSHL